MDEGGAEGVFGMYTVGEGGGCVWVSVAVGTSVGAVVDVGGIGVARRGVDEPVAVNHSVAVSLDFIFSNGLFGVSV